MEGEKEMILGQGKVIKFQNGKKLGVIRKDKVFMIPRNKKKHFFRLYNGWAVNLQLLKELRDIGIETIEIRTNDTKEIYRTHIDNFFRSGIIYKNPKNEKDIQIVLNKKYFTINRPQKLVRWLK